jgi:hypothetical protein
MPTPLTLSHHTHPTPPAALYPCIGDGAAAALGSRCDDSPGRIALTIGTSCAARVVVPCTDVLLPPDAGFASVIDPNTGNPLTTETCALPPPGLWCYRIDHSRVLVGGEGCVGVRWADVIVMTKSD